MITSHSQLIDPASKIRIGWQEWCGLPSLNIPAIKSKIDTGAKTSALHASNIYTFKKKEELWVHFVVHPLQKTFKFATSCTARVSDQRTVMNSGGHKELRYVIQIPITLGATQWEIEVGLTNRDPLRFRMLLGRDALKSHCIIDPGKMLCQGKWNSKKLLSYYEKFFKDKSLL